jgi:hypothetical protein
LVLCRPLIVLYHISNIKRTLPSAKLFLSIIKSE